MAKSMNPLTKTVYLYIRDQLRNDQLSPTLREIGDGCFISHTTVLTHLALLEGMGWIAREIGKARSIRLADQAPDYPLMPAQPRS